MDTPKDSCNTLCIIYGQYLVLTVDAESYVRLGLVGKHASSRPYSKDHYFISVPLKGLSSTSKLLNRVRECLKEVGCMSICKYARSLRYRCIAFMEEARSSSPPLLPCHKISSIPILHLSSSLFESALSPFELDRRTLPNETYLQCKEEKQNVCTLSTLPSL